MLFTSILSLVSKKAAEFAVELGVKAGQAIVGAVRDATVSAWEAGTRAVQNAWQSAKDNANQTKESIAGWLGEFKTPKDSGSPEFKKKQAIREYNALLGTTGTGTPEESVCLPCLAASKGRRRKERQELMRAAQNKAAGDPIAGGRVWAATNRLAGDMDRVEDARLALHTYTANETSPQEGFLKPLRDTAPPGFSQPPLDQVAADFGMDPAKLESMLNDPNSSQRIEIYQRDEAVLGPGPKYTVAFRGSTADKRDWNDNGKNEMGFEAPHQANAIRLGEAMALGAAQQGKDVKSLVGTTGHSKGGSEAQAFAAASGADARVFNPAGFDPQQYSSLRARGITPAKMNIDRTTVIERDAVGKVVEKTTDPLYYSQHEMAVVSNFMKRPVTTGGARELAPVAPSLTGPNGEMSDTEPHSMLQVIEGLERDKQADEQMLKDFLAAKPPTPPGLMPVPLGGVANSTPQFR